MSLLATGSPCIDRAMGETKESPEEASRSFIKREKEMKQRPQKFKEPLCSGDIKETEKLEDPVDIKSQFVEQQGFQPQQQENWSRVPCLLENARSSCQTHKKR